MTVHPANFNDLHKYLVSRAGCLLTLSATGIAARRRDGTTAGVVGYDFWTDTVVRCHIALDSPAVLRALIPALFEYPFKQAGVQKMQASICSDNKRSMELVRHLGFEEVYREPDGFKPGIDAILYRLRREDCRYLSPMRRAA